VRLRVRRETRGMERESERVNPNVLGFSSAKSLTLHTRLKNYILSRHQCQMKVMPHIGVKIILLDIIY